MMYEVTSRHRRGFFTQRLTVRATDPDDACDAYEATWDTTDRLITRIRPLGVHEQTSIRQERQLLSWTTLMIVVTIVGFIAIVWGPKP
jgi:hypothetical protein